MQDEHLMQFEIRAETALGNTQRPVEFRILLGVKEQLVGGSLAYAQLQAKDEGGIGLQDLITAFNPEVVLPDILYNLPRVRDFRIQYKSDEVGNDFDLELDSVLKVGDEDMDITLVWHSGTEDNKRSSSFGGTIAIAGHRFGIHFLGLSGGNYLVAKYAYEKTLTLNFTDMARSVFGPGDYPDVSLDIQNPNVFLVWKPGENSKLLIGLGAGLQGSIDLSGMPLVGDVLGDPQLFGLQEALVLYSTANFPTSEIAEINRELRPFYKDRTTLLPETALKQGFNFTATLLLGGKPNLISLADLSPAQVTERAISPSSSSTAVATASNAPTIPGVTWKQLDKQLGPVLLQRVGFGFAKGKLTLLLDAALKISGLEAQVLGLGFAFALQWPPTWPEVYLSGLGISYTTPQLSISGMFIRATPTDNEAYSFYGSAGFSTKAFGIAGMGAYSKFKDTGQQKGAHSLFLYAMYQGPIGGPAFFFITGIALGFGINRRVRIPKIDEVKDFPFVAMALNPNPNKSLNAILVELVNGNWVPSSPGDYWLAVGLRFTSFKLLDSFVMVLVGFGNKRFELTLMGLSILAWPNKENPIVYIELQVLAHYATDCDLISVEGRLTRNSFILDKNCKLTGGFALYVWVSGPHEGDFVVTMGGYHPHYKVPDHYPKVDRLGLNWVIGPLSIRGEMYFALTPQCIMLGGLMIAEYKLSFLLVTFSYWFDVWIQWAPFYYDLSGGVHLRIELTLKVLGVRVHFSISFGARVQIYGPPFGGVIEVDLGFFSFEIPFGKSNKKLPQPLPWSHGSNENPGFKESFVPIKKNVVQPIDVRVVAGAIKDETDDNGIRTLVVNAYDMVLVVDSFFPITKLIATQQPELVGDATPLSVAGSDLPLWYKDRNKEFGVLPMKKQGLETELSFRLKRKGSPAAEALPLAVMALSKSVARALWGTRELRQGEQLPKGEDPSTLKHIVTGFELHTTEWIVDDPNVIRPDVTRQQKPLAITLLQDRDASTGAFEMSHVDYGRRNQVISFFNAQGFDLKVPMDREALPAKPSKGRWVDIGQKLPQI